ncbi:hypothetical protein ABT294_04845 [Nonomuraea sp. NPDC000554]|uniref:hypothetical protein n=1 Tax=Nonomuraea sp. NPDC000554 TaxID=3154259 RepID=UPI003328B793
MRRITAGAVAAALAVVATGCGIELDAEEVHAAQAFPFSGTELTVKSSTGGLRVLPGTGESVQVERWVRGKAADDGNATWSLRDGTLRLGADCTMVFGDCGARYHVKVPPGVHLKVDTDHDGVILDGLTQDVDVSTSGAIQVSGTSGRLRLLGDYSSVTGKEIRSERVQVRTSAGPINLSFAAMPSEVDLLSRHGRVTATVPTGEYGVTVRSTYGSEVSQIKSTKSPRTIVAKSTSGDVRINSR